jgi:hypothetical protein
VQQSLIDKGDAIGLFYDPGWDGQRFSRSKQVDGLPIRSFPELYREIKGEDPKGPLWQTYLTALQLTGEAFRVAAMPPGTPQLAVDAVRGAIAKLAHDKEFADEARKAFSYVPEYVTGPQTNERMRAMLTTSPELRRTIADFVKAGTASK